MQIWEHKLVNWIDSSREYIFKSKEFQEVHLMMLAIQAEEEESAHETSSSQQEENQESVPGA